ncbi:MAG: glycosyltransferase [Desulfovibrionaceae bacterium]
MGQQKEPRADRPEYRAEAVRREGVLADVRLTLADGRTRHLWGRAAGAREAELAEAARAVLARGGLPVLLGSGLGLAVARLAESGGPLAVVDREAAVLALTGARRAAAERPGALWVDAEDPAAALAAVRAFAQAQGRPPVPVPVPLYLRLDPPYYAALARELARDAAEAPAEQDFWARARYPKFASVLPRVLVLRRPYFLMAEIAAALPRLDIPHRFLEVGEGPTVRPGFVEELLAAVAEFRPDFVLTVNHFGLDREGRLAGLLEDLGLPLASWFVDSPELVLAGYPGQARPGVAVFSFDADGLEPLRALGFGHAAWLPLGTDPAVMRPGAGEPDPSWRAAVSFVGDSLAGPVAEYLEILDAGPAWTARLDAARAAFGASPERSVARFLAGFDPGLGQWLDALDDPARRLAAEKYVTFGATRDYRLDCVRRLTPFAPVVAGDPAWGQDLPPGGWRAAGRLDYAADLPRFYAAAEVNFNCTSLQMKGAVNQRVFDVPACGAFLLTDARRQMEALFEPGRECAVYGRPEDIPGEVERWLADPAGRRALAVRARRRVLAEHTYGHRLTALVAAMRAAFAGRS